VQAYCYQFTATAARLRRSVMKPATCEDVLDACSVPDSGQVRPRVDLSIIVSAVNQLSQLATVNLTDEIVIMLSLS